MIIVVATILIYSVLQTRSFRRFRALNPSTPVAAFWAGRSGSPIVSSARQAAFHHVLALGVEGREVAAIGCVGCVELLVVLASEGIWGPPGWVLLKTKIAGCAPRKIVPMVRLHRPEKTLQSIQTRAHPLVRKQYHSGVVMSWSYYLLLAPKSGKTEKRPTDANQATNRPTKRCERLALSSNDHGALVASAAMVMGLHTVTSLGIQTPPGRHAENRLKTM